MAIRYIQQVLVGIVVVCIAIMMLSTTIDVIGRFFFNAPIRGTVEVNQVLLIFTVFLGLGYTQLMKRHIRVDMIFDRISSTRRRLMVDVLESLLALVIVGFVTYGSTAWAYNSVLTGQYEIGSVRYPVWVGRIAVSFGCLALCAQYVVDIIQTLRSAFMSH